jgi:hypothetical protein
VLNSKLIILRYPLDIPQFQLKKLKNYKLNYEIIIKLGSNFMHNYGEASWQS